MHTWRIRIVCINGTTCLKHMHIYMYMGRHCLKHMHIYMYMGRHRLNHMHIYVYGTTSSASMRRRKEMR